MKTISLLLVAIFTLGLATSSLSQSTRSKKVSKAKTAAIVNTANEFTPGTVFAVDSSNNLLHFDVSVPQLINGSVAIHNLKPAETILGIDFRPATGDLYGLGSTSQLYIINEVTGRATPVGDPFTPALNGTAFGFDFNPTVDRIRVVSDAEQNFRLHPDTGAVVGTDGLINPPGNLVGSAYTNNFSGATSTTLYGIDSGSDQLVIQNPPNDGLVSPVGALGTDTTELVGFDIQTGTTIAYASLTAAAGSSSFYSINLATGAATLIANIGINTTIRGIAVVSGPETIFAVTTSNNLIRFNSNTPGTIVSSTPIVGLQPGETMVGIDFRPGTGELYGLGSTSRLYKIDSANGQTTQVGSGQFSPLLNGTDFGFDFNPTVDRIRIVSDAEQSIAVNPDNAAVAVNANLNPPGNVVAAAYLNNFAGATSTTLYDIDSNSDLLLIQVPATGALTAVGPLNVNTSGNTGFDIAPNGLAFASLTQPAAAVTNFYTITLGSGGATLIGSIGGGEVIRDVAIRLTTEVIYGVTQTSGGTFNLISFNAATPHIIQTLVGISGLQAGELLRGIDFRPANGVLYALGSTSRIYTVDLTTGVATAVGAPFTPVLNGTSFGFDFNPTVDRIRIVSDTEQNLRVNPNTGAVQNTDGALNPAGNIVAAAYTNNFAGATSTTLYDIDSVSDRVVIQAPANDGTLTNLAATLGFDIGPTVGFDISSLTGIAYFTAYPTAAVSPGLYAINLANGAPTLVGIVNTTETLVGISVRVSGTSVPGSDSAAVYNAASGTWFLRNTNTPGSGDTVFGYGPGGAALPIKGDWDGDGDDTAGVYQPSSGAFFLRNTNSAGAADLTFTFGTGGSTILPIAGDWDGDGKDTIGLYDSTSGVFFLRNSNSGGSADIVFAFGVGGALPITGDWNGDGVDTVGVYDPATSTFFLRNANSNGPADITPFAFGAPGGVPLAGDWNGDGTDSIGIYQPATAAWFLSNGFTGSADVVFGYGPSGAVGLAGDWDGQ